MRKEMEGKERGQEETLAMRFYRMSRCKTMAELARVVEINPVTVRLYMLPSDRKSWRPIAVKVLFDWAIKLRKAGGPSIVMGLWSDGEVTIDYEDE